MDINFRHMNQCDAYIVIFAACLINCLFQTLDTSPFFGASAARRVHLLDFDFVFIMPTRVLLAVIARHPEAVEDVLRKARWGMC